MEGQDASKAKVGELLNRGQVAFVHFAGHGFYDTSDPQRSGVLLADDERFESPDVNIHGGPPPKLVFVSAADSARIGTYTENSAYGFAEALLAAGVENFIGAQWPQTDEAAVEFAAAFYDVLFRGATVGTALKEARLQLWRTSEFDALCYVHFGLPEHVLILDQ